MPINSVLNPEKIVKKSNKTVQEAQNFITGGSPIGESAINSVANNIVNFQRAQVNPIRPDIGGMLSTISNNITNNVDNSINNIIGITNKNIDSKIKGLKDEIYQELQKINQSPAITQITQNLQGSVKQISDDYQNRIKNLDAAKPTNILNKFLGVYKNALEFVQFFGNKKNIDTITDNLESLKKSFIDSFETSKLLRQVIIKIVKQLSNLPKATQSGGGINLDVEIPGAGLKRSAPRGLGNIMRGGGKLALGGLALGGLALGGTAAVNALADSERLQPQKSDSGFFGNVLYAFSSIVERFSEAINSMFGIGKKSEKTGGTSGSVGAATGSGGGGTPSSSGGGGGNLNAADITADTAEEKALIATIRESEGTSGPGGYNTVYGGAVVPQLTQMTLKELYDAAKIGGTDKLPARLGGGTIPYKKDEHDSTASGAVQIMPDTLKSLVESGQFNWNQTFSPETQNQMMLALARRRGIDPTKPITMKEIMILRKEWAGMGRFYSGQGGSESAALKRYQENLKEAKSQTKPQVKGQGGPDLPDFMLPPEKRQQLQSLATNVSQPPPQQKPQMNIIPIDLSTKGQQSSGGSSVMATPAPQKKGPSVPMISSNNPDNFLIMYSKMVYNIVDG